jgi:KDO II ethanolaminephosphotransferase
MRAWSKYESVGRHKRLTNPADRFAFRTDTSLDGTYLVIVIGESARYDRMGIFGHSRPNMPELSGIPNLVALRANSFNSSTRLSLQRMFVTQEAVEDGGSGKQRVSEKMAIGVLKKLGFTSELFAMQGGGSVL